MNHKSNTILHLLLVMSPLITFTLCNPVYKVSTVATTLSGYDVGYETFNMMGWLVTSLQVQTVASVTVINNTPMHFRVVSVSPVPPISQAVITPGSLGTFGWSYSGTQFSAHITFATIDIVNSNNVGNYVVMAFEGSGSSVVFKMWPSLLSATYPPSGTSPAYVNSNTLSGNCCYSMKATNTYAVNADVYQTAYLNRYRWIVTISDFTTPTTQC